MEKTISEIESEAIHERRRKRFLKIFVTEALMTVSVVALVIVSLLLAMGYSINPSSETEEMINRMGLLAIQSKPTGATVTIDGNQLFAWTNMSRTVVAGKHEVELSRDGYRTWKKTVDVPAGMMYRLNYPRLFLNEIESSDVVDFRDVDVYSIAHDENTMLVVSKLGEVSILKINEEKPSRKVLDFGTILGEKYLGGLEIVSWSGNSKRVIAKYNKEWLVLNIDKPLESINLTQKYAMNFSEVRFSNDAGDRVIVIEGGNLRKIELNSGKTTEVLMKKVLSFDNLGEDIVLVRQDETGKSVRFLRDGDVEPSIIEAHKECTEGCRMLAVVDKYYGDNYLGVTIDDRLIVYKGSVLDFVNADAGLSVVLDTDLGYITNELTTNGNGEIITVLDESRKKVAVFDTETESVVKYTTLAQVKYVDESLMYRVEDGELVVSDFDGRNEVIIAENVKNGTEVKISRNDKWMYYLSAENVLRRAVITN